MIDLPALVQQVRIHTGDLATAEARAAAFGARFTRSGQDTERQTQRVQAAVDNLGATGSRALGDVSQGMDGVRDASGRAQAAVERLGDSGARALQNLSDADLNLRRTNLQLAAEQDRLAEATEKYRRVSSLATSSDRERHEAELALIQSHQRVRRATTEADEAFRRSKGIVDEHHGSVKKLAGGFTELGQKFNIAGALMGGLRIPAMAAGLSLAASALGALSAAAIELVGELGPLTGAAAALPAVFTGIAGSVVAAKFALSGLGPALKAIDSGDPEKVREALAALPEATRPFAVELHRLKPEFDGLKEAAAEGLMPGLRAGLQESLPLLGNLRTLLNGLGTELGTTAEGMGRLFGSASFRRDFDEMGASARSLMRGIGDGAVFAVRGLTGIGAAARPLTEWFGTLARDMGVWIDRTVAVNRANGDMARFFDHTRAVMTTLGHTIRNFGVGLRNVFEIGGQGHQPPLLTLLENASERFRNFTEGTRGQNQIGRFFAEAQPVMHEFNLILQDIVKWIGRMGHNQDLVGFLSLIRTELLPAVFDLSEGVSQRMGPALVYAATAFLRFQNMLSFSPLISVVAAVSKLSAELMTLIQHSGAFGNVLGTVIASLLAMRVALAGLSVAGRVTGINSLITAISSMGAAGSAGEKGLAGFVQGLRGASGESLSLANHIGRTVVASLRGVRDVALGAAGDIARGFADTFSRTRTSISAFIAGLRGVEDAGQSAGNFAGLLARDFGGGLKQGFMDSVAATRDQITAFREQVVETVASVRSAVTSAAAWVTDTGTRVANTVSTRTQAAAHALMNSALVTQLRSLVVAAAAWVRDTAARVANTIATTANTIAHGRAAAAAGVETAAVSAETAALGANTVATGAAAGAKLGLIARLGGLVTTIGTTVAAWFGLGGAATAAAGAEAAAGTAAVGAGASLAAVALPVAAVVVAVVALAAELYYLVTHFHEVITNIGRMDTGLGRIIFVLQPTISLVAGLVRGLRDLWGALRRVDFSGMFDGLSRFVNRMREFGRNLVDGVIDGIKSRFEDAGHAIHDFIQDHIVGPFQRLLRIHSPSQVMADLGAEIPAGVAQGINGGGGEVDRAMQNLANRVTSGMAGVVAAQQTAAGRMLLPAGLTASLANGPAPGPAESPSDRVSREYAAMAQAGARARQIADGQAELDRIAQRRRGAESVKAYMDAAVDAAQKATEPVEIQKALDEKMRSINIFAAVPVTDPNNPTALTYKTEPVVSQASVRESQRNIQTMQRALQDAQDRYTQTSEGGERTRLAQQIENQQKELEAAQRHQEDLSAAEQEGKRKRVNNDPLGEIRERLKHSAQRAREVADAVKVFVDNGVSKPVLDQLMQLEEEAPGTLKAAVDNGMVKPLIQEAQSSYDSIMAATRDNIVAAATAGLRSAGVGGVEAARGVATQIVAALQTKLNAGIDLTPQELDMVTYLGLSPGGPTAAAVDQVTTLLANKGTEAGTAYGGGVVAGLDASKDPVRDAKDRLIRSMGVTPTDVARLLVPNSLAAGTMTADAYAQSLLTGVNGVQGPLETLFPNLFAPAPGAANTAGVTSGNSFLGGITGSLTGPDAQGKVAGATSAIEGMLTLPGASGKGTASGSNFVDGLIAGMLNPGSQGKVDGATTTLTDLLTGGVRSKLDEHSPSRVAHRIGRFFAEGLANGVSDNAHLAERAANAIGQAMSGGVQVPDLSGVTLPQVPQAVAAQAAAPVGVPAQTKKTEFNFYGGVHQADLSGTLRKAQADANLAALALGGDHAAVDEGVLV